MKIRVMYNALLGGWYIVRGPHQTPIGGRFETKAAAQQHLRAKKLQSALLGIFKETTND